VVIALLCVCLVLAGLYFTGTLGTLPTPIVVQPTVPPTSPKTSSIITDMVMAKDVQGNTFDPVGVTYSFPANQAVFHAVITIKDAPKDTAIGVIWLSSDGQRMGEMNSKPKVHAILISGSSRMPANYRPATIAWMCA